VIKSKIKRSPWWLLLLAFFAIMATGIDCDAGGRRMEPRKAAFELIFYKDPPDGVRDLFVRLFIHNDDNGLLVEKCKVNGRTTYRSAKRVDPVKLETETKNEGGE